MKTLKILAFGIFLILILGLLAALIGSVKRDKDIEEVIDKVDESVVAEPVAAGQELIGEVFNVPGLGIGVALAEGPVDFTGAGSSGTIIYLSDHAVMFSVNGQKYIAAPVVANTGGSGQFVYLVLYREVGGSYQHQHEVLLGDRIIVQKVTPAASGQVLVEILDRPVGVALAALPTELVELDYEVKEGRLLPLFER